MSDQDWRANSGWSLTSVLTHNVAWRIQLDRYDDASQRTRWVIDDHSFCRMNRRP